MNNCHLILIGIVQGAESAIVAPVYRHTFPILAELPKLLSLYHNYQDIVYLILELFNEYTKILFFLSEVSCYYLQVIIINPSILIVMYYFIVLF